MSTPRSGPSGLRQGRSGAATSQGVSHRPQEAGWGAVLVNECWAPRIVTCPHGASLETPDPCRLPCSAGPPWLRRRQWLHRSTPATQTAAPPTTRPGRNTSEAGTAYGASQELGGGRIGGGVFHYSRPLPLVQMGVRSEWLRALEGRWLSETSYCGASVWLWEVACGFWACFVPVKRTRCRPHGGLSNLEPSVLGAYRS